MSDFVLHVAETGLGSRHTEFDAYSWLGVCLLGGLLLGPAGPASPGARDDALVEVEPRRELLWCGKRGLDLYRQASVRQKHAKTIDLGFSVIKSIVVKPSELHPISLIQNLMHPPLHIRGEQVVGVMPPPPGTAPNFADPPSVKHDLVGINIAFSLTSLVFVVIRLYTAYFITTKAVIQDSMVVLAWLLALGASITLSIDTRYGLGLHLWDVPLSTFLPNFWIVGTIGATLCGISIMFSKLSILSFYIRFCRYRRLRIAVYVLMVVVTIYSVTSSFSFLYACQPMAKYWDPRITRGSCIRTTIIPVFNGVMNTTTDFIILLLPIIMLWTVKVPKRQKIGLILIFMTGGFVVVVSIIRLKMSMDLMHNVDVSWGGAFVMKWWTVEMHVAIICTCLPAGKPFLRRHYPKALGSSLRTSHSTNKAATPSRNVQQLHKRDGDEVPLREFLAPGQDEESQANVSTSTVECMV